MSCQCVCLHVCVVCMLHDLSVTVFVPSAGFSTGCTYHLCEKFRSEVRVRVLYLKPETSCSDMMWMSACFRQCDRWCVRKPFMLSFHPRPVLAFGYYHCLRLSVCPSVRQSWACLRYNSSPVQDRITKFGVKDLASDPYCFKGWMTLTFKVKFNLSQNLPHFELVRQRARGAKYLG